MKNRILLAQSRKRTGRFAILQYEKRVPFTDSHAQVVVPLDVPHHIRADYTHYYWRLVRTKTEFVFRVYLRARPLWNGNMPTTLRLQVGYDGKQHGYASW